MGFSVGVLVGTGVGANVGIVGAELGWEVGSPVVGAKLGVPVGVKLGSLVGMDVGTKVGMPVGALVGDAHQKEEEVGLVGMQRCDLHSSSDSQLTYSDLSADVTVIIRRAVVVLKAVILRLFA